MKEIISDLIEKHQSRDPFEIANNLGIIVICEPLGTINGYYNTAYNQKFIHINCDLPEYKKKFTAAHELGHALLHPTSNARFLKMKTHLSLDRYEIQANQFAVNLIISDTDLKEYQDYTISQFACLYGCPEELIKLRFDTCKFKVVQGQ